MDSRLEVSIPIFIAIPIEQKILPCNVQQPYSQRHKFCISFSVSALSYNRTCFIHPLK